MSLESKLENIETDIRKGLKLKSADRLRNLINEYPDNQKLWNKLAELYYESGFLDGAGKYWILTEPTDDRIKNSVEIYENSVNYSGYQILQEITFRGDKSKLTEYGKKKIIELENDSSDKVNHIPEFEKKLNRQKRQQKKKEKTSFKDKLVGKLILLLVIAVPIFAVIGIIAVINWIF